MSFTVSELYEKVCRKLKDNIMIRSLSVYTKEGYDYLTSFGFPCTYVERGAGTFYLDDTDALFMYQSKEEKEGQVIFYDVKIISKEYYELMPTYESVYYKKDTCTELFFVNGDNVTTEEFSPEYEYVFQYGSVKEMKHAIRRIMEMNDYTYTVKNACEQKNKDVLDKMISTFGMYCPSNLTETVKEILTEKKYVYMFVGGGDWEDQVIYTDKELAIQASIQHPAFRVEIFELKDDGGYYPTYMFYKYGMLNGN